MSGSVKLTKVQQELLDAIASGAAVHFHPYMGWFNRNEYYSRRDTNARCTTAARGLLEKGMVEKFDQTWRGHQLRIKQ